jgi:hypothetical protein
MVIFSFPQGTQDEPLPWAKVVFTGSVFACRLMTELEVGGDFGATGAEHI